MRVKKDYRSSSKAVYDIFCEAHKEVNISYADWTKVIFTYNRKICRYLLETGEVFKLPRGFGYLSIIKKKNRVSVTVDGKTHIILPINWKKTKEEGKIVYHMNAHTSGYRASWKWFSSTARFFLSDFYNFRASREASRLLKDYMVKDAYYHQIYKEWKKNDKFYI